MAFDSGQGDIGPQATAGLALGANSPDLTRLMLDMDIEPGSSPSYELCKTIYAKHPLGAKMASSPVKLAQSQARILTIPGSPEKELIKAFEKEWKRIGATGIIYAAMILSRIYGISTLAVLAKDDKGKLIPSDQPIPDLYTADLFFNQLDPLNTAGSLVLNQDPNATDFMKPTKVSVGGTTYHISRVAVTMNEQPIWIEWTNSAFGFVGRSVYQRALYPMQSYLQSMISNNVIQEKLAVLVYKMFSPGSALDQIAQFFGFQKRSAIKYSNSGSVLSIGQDEDLASLNLEHVHTAGEYSRKNILDDIATSAEMPAVMLNQETLAEGFGEGTEDAKIIARYIEGVRNDAEPLYTFMDRIVMAKAWNKDFYKAMQNQIKAYKKVPYETAFMEWKNSFEATWPNLLAEPDSEKAKKSDIKLKSVTALAETLLPVLDPGNKARFVDWMQDQVNADEFLFDGEMDLDIEALETYEPPSPMMGGAEKEPREPRPFSMES